ncbi:MAG: hypothetical protein RID07_00705, partial [Lacipirellulaceae bacterium]
QPFLRGDFPICPVGPPAAQNNGVEFVSGSSTTGNASPTTGWKYNSTLNEFICNNSNATASDNTITYDQL